MLMDGRVGARLVRVRHLKQPARDELDEVEHVARQLHAVVLDEIPDRVVGRAGDIDAKVVLAGIAVLLVRALGRLALRRPVGVQLLDVPVVDDRGRVASQRVGGRVDLGWQRLAILRWRT